MSNHPPPFLRSHGVVGSDDETAGVAAAVKTDGELETTRAVGVDRLTLARFLARLPVRRGTLAQVREWLARRAASTPRSPEAV